MKALRGQWQIIAERQPLRDYYCGPALVVPVRNEKPPARAERNVLRSSVLEFRYAESVIPIRIGSDSGGFTNQLRIDSKRQTGSDAMPVLPLRTDFDAWSCRLAARHAGDASQARRLLSIAAIYDGASRGEAAGLGSVTVQIVCDWVKKFNAHGPDGLINRKAPGKPPKLTAEQLAALAAIVESGPIPASHGVVRWRIIDLCQWIWEEFRVSVSEDTVEPSAAGNGVPQAFGKATSSCASSKEQLRILKKFPGEAGADRKANGRLSRHDRDLVRR